MSSEATSDHGAGGDQAVWVHDYTTSTGVTVPGHWRKKAHRDSGADTSADTGTGVASGAGGGLEGPTGAGGVRTAEATIGVTTGVRPGGGRVQGMPEPDERVSAGLQALRQRRELLAQANPAGPAASSAPDATGNHSSGRVKCSTCGQFKGDQHTCTAGAGVVVDPTAAAATEGVVDRHGDVQVTEYVPYSGRTAWSVAGPQGRYLVTPNGKGSFLVWKSDSITDGRTCPDVAGGIRTAARLATDLPAGRPGSESWNAQAAETIAALPNEGTHVFEPVRSRDGSQLSQEVLISHLSNDDEGFGQFSVYRPGSDSPALFSYGGGTSRTREEAAQAAAREAGRQQQPEQCDACGQFISFEKPHECPAIAQLLANQSAVTPTSADPAEDEGAPAEPEVPEAPEGLPAGDYADLKGDARVKAMVGDLEESVKAVVESGQLGAWLGAMATNGMTRWSFNNQMLAMIQMAFRGKDLDGLHMMGFRQWEKLNRKVAKGAKAVWILAPMTRKFVEEDDDGTRREKVKTIGFKSVPVFDISDTHGDPLPASPVVPPTGEATPGTLEGLRDRVGQAGYTYEEVKIPGCNPATGDGTQGYTDPQSKKVVVDSRLPGAMKASVIAHELGHIHCGHVDGDYSEYQRHRGRMETEAEMTSFLTMRARGASKEQSESFAAGYIAAWSKGDAKIIHGAVDKAVRAHNKILEGEWPSS